MSLSATPGAEPKPGHGCRTGLKNNPHITTLVLSLLVWGGAVALVVFWLTGRMDSERWVFAAISAFWLLFYICYLWEALGKSSTWNYLRSKIPEPQASQHHANMMIASTECHERWGIVCYHKEYSTYTDSDGNLRSTEETVVTHRASTTFSFGSVVDDSGTLPGQFTPLRKIAYKVRAVFEPGHEAARDAAFHQWVAANRRDDYQSTSSTFEIPGFKPKVLSFLPGEIGCCASSAGWYFLCAIVGLAWPYKVYVSSLSSRTEIQLCKKLTVHEDCAIPSAPAAWGARALGFGTSQSAGGSSMYGMSLSQSPGSNRPYRQTSDV